MIIITGATGALNGATVEHLLDRVPADEIAVAVRDVAKAQRFAERGVQAAALTTPTRHPCPPPSPAPTSCCSSPPTTRAQTP